MKKWIIVIIVLAIIGIGGYNYLYQDHRDIKTEAPEFVTTSEDISKEFIDDPIAAEKKYLNKTIEVQGSITELNTNDLTINSTIFCVFDVSITEELSLNKVVTVKGRFIGYDDLLEQIKIDQTNIIN
ncbi:hypothetical protein D7030_09580 [Flavobacteriaceae bacterium AU392]|nr:hypothetical protein D1817_07235 [Flavobacteriaceae bacterium]RKM83537.1 hypothetical protein D7030_09580 [Flavobacteriaceae bacterium AU392]